MSLMPIDNFSSDMEEDEGKSGGIRKWTLTFATIFLIGDIKLQGAEKPALY